MKVLKIILILFVVIIGGSAIWLATLDGKYEVVRSTEINATPEAVYAEISDFKTWPEWSAWFERDTTMKTIYGENTKGKGASYSWESENSGNGKMTILEAEPGKSMETKIEFDGMGSSNGFWTLEPTENGTKVSWGFKGEMPFFFRFMAAGMEDGVGPDFETGLANLKAELESRKPALAVTTVNFDTLDIYYTHHEVSWEEMTSDLYGESFGKIMTYLAEDASNMTGAPMAVFHVWDEVNKTTVADIAIPCNSSKTATKAILKGKTPGGKMLKATHVGSYDSMGDTHYAIDDYMLANGLEMNGPVLEIYVTDPSDVNDPSELKTDIYYPIK